MNPLDLTMSRLKNEFESALQCEVQRWSDWPQILKDACIHVLFGGGKRVRPILSLMVAEAIGADVKRALPWAIAVELIHTYSLVHDDLPSMDDDLIRRGRPTCHIKYGEANAILAGDALLTQAFSVIGGAPLWSDACRMTLIRTIAQAAGGAGMVGGQIYDISGNMKDLDAVLQMQSLKTGALIRAAAEGGALAGGGNPAQIEHARQFGTALGLLFQLTDDRLDKDQDLKDGGNNVLHYIDEAKLVLRIGRVADEARRALTGLSEESQPLYELIDRIVHRNV